MYGLINGENVSKVISEIIRFNFEDDQKRKDSDVGETDYNREPIHLLIESGGGILYDCFALLSVMESSKSPIYTYCYGYCMSAAVPPYLAGTKRFAGRHATFMLHQVKEPIGDEKVFVIENRLEEAKRLMNKRIKYVTSRSNVSVIDFEMNKHIDWFIDVNEAVDLGIVHEII